MRLIFPLTVITTAIALFLLLATRTDAALSSAQKLHKSETVIDWYNGKGRWTLRPNYDFCADLRSASEAGRCWRHRTNLRWHIERAQRLRPIDWIAVQIRYATLIGQSGGDHWPNCPDPYDRGGYSWQDTVSCENNGNWFDSPGYYRCGLQFDPMWERHYGRRFCP